jgi:DMSO/TMAO reductase YedYZ molybdopterin-dependent catalytic subunit
MHEHDHDSPERNPLTRRDLFQLSAAAAALGSASPVAARNASADPQLREAAAKLEYLTPIARGRYSDKGKAGVLNLPEEKLREIGLVPETWSLEVVADTASSSLVERPLTRAEGNALDWNGLMKLAERHVVRFLHPCFCVNVDDPFHTSVWEGVPLREIIWLVKPKANIRRVYYQSYHQEGVAPFQASLPLGQVLETPPGQVPVVLAYKMNGEPIPASHGGPARMVLPGGYGDKAIKWVQRIVLTNDFKANDSDAADFNADVETAMKTKARFINAPKEVAAGKPAALTGFALAGISGVAKVQYCVHSQNDPWPADDPYWTGGTWKDAEILPAPTDWGGGLPGGKLPAMTSQIDRATGAPLQWPMRYTLVHWAALLPGLAPGSYDLCCRTIDGNGIAQPMPRPFLRTGANGIQRVTLVVKA